MLERRPALRRIVLDIGAIRRAPFHPSVGAAARSLDVDGADLTALRLIGLQQTRTAPSAQGRGELPGNVDGVADPGIHAKSTGRDDEMRRVAGDEDAALQIML